MDTTAVPLPLPANQPRQFYRGGGSIAELRGTDGAAEYGPEDWVASTTSRFGFAESGLSPLPDGLLLRDAVQRNPQEWLGAEHIAAFGDSTALLVKLLDAGQRLPVHCHPSDRFARQHLGSRFGKTEAWIVVGTAGADPVVYLGFREDVDAATVARWVGTQDSSTMLGALNRIPVRPGDTVHVPAGTPHAIGPGVFLVELQQPTDFSITLEWEGFLSGAEAAFLGLDQETALHTLNRSGLGDATLAELITRTGDRGGARIPLLAESAVPFFRAERLQPGGGIELEPSFGVLIALSGHGRLDWSDGSLPLHRGATIVIPHAAEPVRLVGDCTLVHCRPPAPQL
ncbi:class I mannose-6-phosphate isomerase [Saccharopolyspora sp. HNM0983]|uniref:Class I mannose-6-phosphate isomerase n=1 Tax=Saccharopolyspora montiporae TaxID=2781240 RepID=A0A929BF02_9PSEU|nr:class I mannose-6-phosphate isomerase [Saccharopolyspora sp. HNM0983]MBE9376257.1 class I mannose-6-phosphate isomerase [Saccharopolyspora sp. HNM0983]